MLLVTRRVTVVCEMVRGCDAPASAHILSRLAARAPGPRLARPGGDVGISLCVSGAFLHNGGSLLGTRPAEIVGPASGRRCRLAAEKARIGRRGPCRSQERVAFDGRRLGQWHHRPRNRPFPRTPRGARRWASPRACAQVGDEFSALFERGALATAPRSICQDGAPICSQLQKGRVATCGLRMNGAASGHGGDLPLPAGYGTALVALPALEAIRRHRRIPHGRLNVAVTEEGLERARILALVGIVIATAVPQ